MKRSVSYFVVTFFLLGIGIFNGKCSDLSEEPAVASERIPSASLLIQVQDHPDDQSLRLRLARAYIGEKDFISAVSECIAILRSNKNCAEAHYLIAKTLRPLRGNPQKCLEHAREAARLSDNPAYQRELLDTLYSVKHFDEALQLAQELAKHSDDLSLRYDLAVIYLRLGKREEMRKTIDDILSINPNYDPALVFRASDSIDYQNYKEALPDVDRALSVNPDDVLAHYLRGRIAFADKDYQRAQTEFEFVVDRDPFHHHALYQLMRTYSTLGKKNESEMTAKSLAAVKNMPEDRRETYRSYLLTHPDTLETHYSIGLIYLEIGRGKLAEDEFRNVLNCDPNHQQARFYLAQIQMASGKFDRALPYLQTLLEGQPQSSNLHALMAQCFLEIQDATRAAQSLRQALELDPKDPLANRIRELWSKRSVQSATNTSE